MKKWTHTLLVSTIVLGSFPYDAINVSITAEATDIKKVGKQQTLLTETQETDNSEEVEIEQTELNTEEPEQLVSQERGTDLNLEENTVSKVNVDHPQNNTYIEREESEIQETKIIPRKTVDFEVTADEVALPIQNEYKYTNVSKLAFVRSDEFNKNYKYSVAYENEIILETTPGNTVDFKQYQKEGIYRVFMQGVDELGGPDSGYFYNNIQTTASSVNIDGVINTPEDICENPSSIIVGRDEKDTYGKFSFTWVITNENDEVVLSCTDKQPDQIEIDILPPGEYTITNTVTEAPIDGYITTEAITDTSSGKFKIVHGKVNVEHILVDAAGNVIETYPEEKSGKIGSDYQTEPIDIQGYELVQDRIPENQNGKYQKTDQTVKYYYKKIKTKIHIEYVDEKGNPLATGEIISGEYGEDYESKTKEIHGYDLVDVPTNANGKHTDKDQTVTYVYKKKATKVIVNHVDEKGNTLTDSDLINGLFDDTYNTTAKEIPGYKLTTVPSNATGKHTVEPTEVTYVYKKIKSNINVEYVDEKGKPISPNEKIFGEYGDMYISTPKEIPGYDLVTLPNNAQGTHTDKDQTVTYVYKKKATKVTVNYVDEAGNELVKSEVINGKFAEEYNTKPKKIPGYILSEVPNNASGTHTVESIEVTYVYKKIEAPTVDDTIEGSKEVTGKGTPDSKVIVTFPNGDKVTVDVDKDGNWKAEVPGSVELKTGDKITAVTLDPLTGATSDLGTGNVLPLSNNVLETGTNSTTNNNKLNTDAEESTSTIKEKNKLPDTGETPNNNIITLGLVSLILAFFGKVLLWRRPE